MECFLTNKTLGSLKCIIKVPNKKVTKQPEMLLFFPKVLQDITYVATDVIITHYH